jgi:aspartyl-tRNA synthetase
VSWLSDSGRRDQSVKRCDLSIWAPVIYRSHTCGRARKADVGKTVRLSGWVHRVRDHGGVLFIDLRDHYGMTQVVADPDSPAFKTAETVRGEWVIRVDGKVKARAPETESTPTCRPARSRSSPREIEVLSAGQGTAAAGVRRAGLSGGHAPQVPLPRPAPRDAAQEHHEAHQGHRVDAPRMTRSASTNSDADPDRLLARRRARLPGAEPHPSRQVLRAAAGAAAVQAAADGAGFDRYFQIAPCFRDEDPRADRLPGEFYQLDLEMSFVTQEDVFDTMEPVIRGVFEEFAEGKPVTPDFPRIPYDEAMRKYGSDKPDLRNPIEMQDVTEHFRGSGFKVFAGMIEKDPKVRGLGDPGPGTGGSRAFCDRMNAWAQGEGQPGSATSSGAKGEEGGRRPARQEHRPERTEAIRTSSASRTATPCSSSPAIRRSSTSSPARRAPASARNSASSTRPLRALLDRRLPVLRVERGREEGRLLHNPFSMPQGGWRR